MNHSPTEVAVREALQRHGRLSVAVDALGDDDDLYVVDLTSHASVNVMLALEDRFDIEFPEERLQRSTFGSIASLRAALDELIDA